MERLRQICTQYGITIIEENIAGDAWIFHKRRKILVINKEISNRQMEAFIK